MKNVEAICRPMVVFLSVFSCLFTSQLALADAPSVHFAGVAIVGNASDSGSDFPVISDILNERDMTVPQAQRISYSISNQIKLSPKIQIDLDLAENMESSLGVALTFNWENTTVDLVDTSNRISTDVHAQAIYFDYRSKRIIRAYPFAVQAIDILQNAPTEADIRDNTEKAVYGEQGIVSQFVTHLKTSRDFDNKDSIYLKVKVPDIEPNALATIQSTNLSEDYVRNLIGFSFGRYLSSNAEVPILPYTSDQALNNTMLAKFADGTIYNFTVPDPDFVFEVTFQEFRQKQLQKKVAGTSFGFAVYYDLTITQPLTGRVYLNNSYRRPVVATFPATKTNYDSAKWFHNAVFALSDQLTNNLINHNEKWLDKWGIKKYDKKQIKDALGVIEKAKQL